MIHRNLTQHTQLDELFFPVESTNITGKLEIVKNEDIILPIYEQLVADFGLDQIQTKIESYQDKRFYVSFRLFNQLHPVAKNDCVYPEILIHNSYDKSIAPTVTLGFVRQICKNGMMAFHRAETVHLRQGKEFNPAQLVPIFQKLATIESSLVSLKELSQYPVTRPQLALIRSELSRLDRHSKLRFTEEDIDIALQTARREANLLHSPMNAWLLYNGINNPINHAVTRYLLPEEVRAIDEQILAIVKAVTFTRPTSLSSRETMNRRLAMRNQNIGSKTKDKQVLEEEII